METKKDVLEKGSQDEGASVQVSNWLLFRRPPKIGGGGVTSEKRSRLCKVTDIQREAGRKNLRKFVKKERAYYW